MDEQKQNLDETTNEEENQVSNSELVENKDETEEEMKPNKKRKVI